MTITPEQAKAELARRAAKKGMVGKASAWLGKWEPISRSGLSQLSQMIPKGKITGNLPADLARGMPRIIADTMTQVAPNFVSKGSLLSGAALEGLGAAAPAIKTMASGLGRQLESASGIAPRAEGSLEAAYKDPTLIFSKGKEEAAPLYRAAQAEMKGSNVWKGGMRNGILEMEKGGQNVFRSTPENVQIVKKALFALNRGRVLEPAEALTARKAVDALHGSKAYSQDVLVPLRAELDAMAKESENIAKADPMFKRGVQGQALRNLLPQNKYGGASAFKMGIAPALTALGGAVGGPPGAATGGALAAGVLSPAVQGAAATGLGIAERSLDPMVQNPGLGSSLVAILKSMRKKKKNEDTHS